MPRGPYSQTLHNSMVLFPIKQTKAMSRNVTNYNPTIVVTQRSWANASAMHGFHGDNCILHISTCKKMTCASVISIA